MQLIKTISGDNLIHKMSVLKALLQTSKLGQEDCPELTELENVTKTCTDLLKITDSDSVKMLSVEVLSLLMVVSHRAFTEHVDGFTVGIERERPEPHKSQ